MCRKYVRQYLFLSWRERLARVLTENVQEVCETVSLLVLEGEAGYGTY
jgi:hypothetical protein